MDIEAILGENQSPIWDETLRDFINDRVLVFNDNIDDNVIEDIIMYIIKWNKEDKDLPIEKRKKIRLYISSPGGNTFNGNILSNVILQSKTPIIGIALDLCASAAYYAFLACDERIAFQETSFLQHEGEISIENSRSKAKQTAEFFDSMEDKAKQFILSRTNITAELYDQVYDNEFWMDAEKAKELGVIHKIIGQDCDLDYIL